MVIPDTGRQPPPIGSSWQLKSDSYLTVVSFLSSPSLRTWPPSSTFPPSDVFNLNLSTGPQPTSDLTCPANPYPDPSVSSCHQLPQPLCLHTRQTLPRVSTVPRLRLLLFILTDSSANQSESQSCLSIEFLPKTHQPQLLSPLIPSRLHPLSGL